MIIQKSVVDGFQTVQSLTVCGTRGSVNRLGAPSWWPQRRSVQRAPLCGNVAAGWRSPVDKETIKQIAAEIAAQLPFGERTGPVLVLWRDHHRCGCWSRQLGSDHSSKPRGRTSPRNRTSMNCWSSFGPILKWSKSVNQVGSRLTPSWLRRSSQKLADGIGPSASGKTYAAANSKRSSTRYKSAMRIWSVAILRRASSGRASGGGA